MNYIFGDFWKKALISLEDLHLLVVLFSQGTNFSVRYLNSLAKKFPVNGKFRLSGQNIERVVRGSFKGKPSLTTQGRMRTSVFFFVLLAVICPCFFSVSEL